MALDLAALAVGVGWGVVAGVLGGAASGLLGIGGGLIYTPLFHLLFPDLPIGAAVFASLGAVMLTSLSSCLSHWRLGHVDAGVWLKMLGVAPAAALGLYTTLQFPDWVVLAALGALVIWMIWDLGREAKDGVALPLVPASVAIGWISGFLGIGGALMLVGVLRRHLPLRFAVGTASALAFTLSLAAIALNALLAPAWREVWSESFSLLVGLWLGVAASARMSSGFFARLHAEAPEASARRWMQWMLGGLLAWIAALLVWEFARA